VVTLNSSSNSSSFNYLALSVPALGLYISFFSIVLCFHCCYIIGLLGNFRYPLLAYYSAILLLNAVYSSLGMYLYRSSFRLWNLVTSSSYSVSPTLGSIKSTFLILLNCFITSCTASSRLSPLSFFTVSYSSKA
jgi:hypothetical protein